ncbi:MAG: hypothetical protein R3C20_12305 [Planctomycetaceae bacterium]
MLNSFLFIAWAPFPDFIRELCGTFLVAEAYKTEGLHSTQGPWSENLGFQRGGRMESSDATE